MSPDEKFLVISAVSSKFLKVFSNQTGGMWWSADGFFLVEGSKGQVEKIIIDTHTELMHICIPNK